MKQPQTQKKLRQSILSFLTLISLQGMVSALEVGDEVSAKTVGKAEFIQGSAPEKWEKGKVYVLECWATWCAPCIAAIPHVDGLYDKYRDQGLVMIGMNVFEDGRDKVVKFVDEKSEGMSYPVAYVGRGGAFENEWLKPAGVKGIPHAFVVKDGRLLFKTHPMKLTSQMIETLLEGGEAESELLARMKSAEENKGTLQQNLMAFKNAKNASDAAAMETAMAGVRNLNPDDSNLAPMAIELKLVKKQWLELKDQLEKMLKKAEIPPTYISTKIVPKIVEEEDVSPALLQFLVETLNRGKSRPGATKTLVALLQSKLGNKDEALQAAKAGLEEVKKGGKFPVEPFEAFVRSIEDDDPLTLDALNQALKEAMKEK